MKEILITILAGLLIIGAWLLADFLSKVVTMKMIMVIILVALVIYIIKIFIEERR